VIWSSTSYCLHAAIVNVVDRIVRATKPFSICVFVNSRIQIRQSSRFSNRIHVMFFSRWLPTHWRLLLLFPAMDTSNRADDMDLELNFPTDLGGNIQSIFWCLLITKTKRLWFVHLHRVVSSWGFRTYQYGWRRFFFIFWTCLSTSKS
jgi:hypothetical protein